MRKKGIARALAGTALAGLITTAVYAANPEPVTVEVEFVDPITITETNALQFGFVDSNLANTETIAVAPGGGLTDPASRILGGTQAAASLTVTASAGTPMTITVGSIVSGAGYSLGTFLCDYNSGGAAACTGAGLGVPSAAASATLNVGATLTGDGTATAGLANGSFTVTINYQ